MKWRRRDKKEVLAQGADMSTISSCFSLTITANSVGCNDVTSKKL